MEIDKYLVQNASTRPHRLASLSQAGSVAGDSQMDDTSVPPTPRDESPAPTPRTLSLSGTNNMGRGSPLFEASSSDLNSQYSPRSGKPRGGFAFSDRPLLGGDEDLARSKSFSGQELRQGPSNLSVTTGRISDEESTQAMRRLPALLHAATDDCLLGCAFSCTLHLLFVLSSQALSRCAQGTCTGWSIDTAFSILNTGAVCWLPVNLSANFCFSPDLLHGSSEKACLQDAGSYVHEAGSSAFYQLFLLWHVPSHCCYLPSPVLSGTEQ